MPPDPEYGHERNTAEPHLLTVKGPEPHHLVSKRCRVGAKNPIQTVDMDILRNIGLTDRLMAGEHVESLLPN